MRTDKLEETNKIRESKREQRDCRVNSYIVIPKVQQSNGKTRKEFKNSVNSTEISTIVKEIRTLNNRGIVIKVRESGKSEKFYNNLLQKKEGNVYSYPAIMKNLELK